ncbi:MAG: tetratricopeptide repeat protein [Desulfobacterales bacterium]|nr:tetratricopeptide repeat protein [Desulfobacterales bacterium]
MISVNFKDEKNGTRVKVVGNNKFSEYVTKTLDSPPRILVDIFTVVPTFETVNIPTKSRDLKGMRVGHHPKNIRVVLDIKGEDIPRFVISSDREGLTIFIKSRTPILPSVVLSPRQLSGQGELTTELSTQEDNDGKNSIVERQQRPDPESKLTQMEVDDGQDDTALFLEGLNKYKDQNWSGTIGKFSHLIKRYPSGRYTERAYFLLAKSYEQLYSDSIPVHFKKVTKHYEDAINNSPNSRHVPCALLAVGDLCFKIKYYIEALGYYNLVLQKTKNTPCALHAMKQKAKILHLKNRREEALSVLEDLVSRDPDMRQKTEAEIEIAKILHELNAFRKSLDIISQLRTRNPQNIYQYPEISLYLGYNYQQLGDSVRARKNLFRFYNSCPDREMNHLILTKIGDTYRDEGLIEDAVKIYQLVRERYPDTEGARISSIRLAEQQEEGNLNTESIVALSRKKIGKGRGTPREIYEDIINNPLDKDKKDPLTHLALLKLAVLHQKEKNFDKSLNALKRLFRKYPRTSLKKEAKHTLQKTIELILKEDMKRTKYISIINMYEREKELFSIIDSPEPFLTIARACIHLNLEDMATEMFRKADPLLQDKEKPPDLLFFLSNNLCEKERFINALARLKLLIDNHPSDKYAKYAYRLRGNIFFRQKRYAQATEMFSSALKYPLTRCERAILLIDKAGALAECSFNEKAFEATREADSLKGACDSPYDYIYQEIGDLYLNLGYPKEAAAVFNQAIEIAKEKPSKIPLKFKVAHCYWLLNKKEDSLALYDQISSLNDPFWSNLAKASIEEIHVSRENKKQITN